MTHRVVVLETGAAFDARADEPLLEAAAREGIRLPHECTLGGCGTCRIKLMHGSVHYDEFPLALTPEEAEAGFALACQARACSDLTISVPAEDLPPPRRCGAVVTSVRPWTAEIAHLQLEIECDELRYAPGQYMNVLLDDGTHRSFSMASPPAANRVDFHVRQLPGGRFTDGELRRLRSGDRLEVEIPHGTFRLHAEDWRPLVMVATGTGLAPIKSMLESLFDDADCPPVCLYWGMRTEADLYLAAEIARWGERLYEFQFVPVLSRAGAACTGQRGYVQAAVVRDLPDLSEHAIYLCGSPVMIADAKRRFLACGAAPEYLYADAFTLQHEAVV
jgi:CDP-4-dehydro-6-deoxyglucose reductase, E3